MVKKINLLEVQGLADTDQVEIAEVNGNIVRLVRASGESSWYLHEQQDKFIVVVKGSLVVHAEDASTGLNEYEGILIPRNVMHKIVALKEALVLVVEPKPSWRDN